MIYKEGSFDQGDKYIDKGRYLTALGRAALIDQSVFEKDELFKIIEKCQLKDDSKLKEILLLKKNIEIYEIPPLVKLMAYLEFIKEFGAMPEIYRYLVLDDYKKHLTGESYEQIARKYSMGFCNEKFFTFSVVVIEYLMNHLQEKISKNLDDLKIAKTYEIINLSLFLNILDSYKYLNISKLRGELDLIIDCADKIKTELDTLRGKILGSVTGQNISNENTKPSLEPGKKTVQEPQVTKQAYCGFGHGFLN